MSTPPYCPSCGHPVPPGSPTCPNCGHVFSPQPQPQYQPQMPYPQPPKQKNPLLLVVIILGGLLVAGIVVAIMYFAFLKEDNNDSKDEKSLSTIQYDIASSDSIAAAAMTAGTNAESPSSVVEEKSEPARPKISSPYDYVVKGSIGKYKIEMQISFQAGGNIAGRYRYLRNNGGWLTLHGTHYGNSFDMYETTKSGEVTGTFSGSYTINGESLKLNGTMMNAKATTYSFNASGFASN